MRTMLYAPGWSAAPGSIKRIGYILGLVGAIVALLVGLALEYASGQAGSYDVYLLPLTAACLLVLTVGFVRAKREFLLLELSTFTVLSAFFLLELGLALYVPATSGQVVNDRLTEFGFWFPTLYASLLFILGIDRGWRFSAWHFVAALLLGLPYLITQFRGQGDLQVVYSLSQLYLSSGVAIATVIVFARYTQSVVKAKGEMERLAYTDFVTDLMNRRQLERLLEQEISRKERYGGDLSVLLLDIDHFKQVNDRHGHAVGDVVLRDIAGLLLAESRTTDYIGRWGGEEFLMILPGTDGAAAAALGQRIVERIDRHEFADAGHVTLSGGIAVLALGDQLEDMIDRADAALYRAKDEGRNRVHGSSAPSPMERRVIDGSREAASTGSTADTSVRMEEH